MEGCASWRLVSVADGAWSIFEGDGDGLVIVNMGFLVDDGDGAEEQIANVGQDSGTTRGDLVVGKEFIQFAEGMVDAGGGFEILALAGEGRGEFSQVTLFAFFIGVLETEAGAVVRNRHTAKAAAGEAMLTMERGRLGGEARGFGIHGSSFLRGVGLFQFGKS
jgi:hypothetical protein